MSDDLVISVRISNPYLIMAIEELISNIQRVEGISRSEAIKMIFDAGIGEIKERHKGKAN